MVLGPDFQRETFQADASSRITQEFLTRLAAYYADPADTDVCSLFTAAGLAAARIVDPRLRAPKWDEANCSSTAT